MKRLFTILPTLFLATLSFVYAQPKHEVRAAWLTTAYGLDWPSRAAVTNRSTERQKAELSLLLDKLEAANFNTVLFQVRIRGDVAYPSLIESFNEVFTGKEGTAPPYDPLAFAIRECHRRGMELHAWLVTIPLGTDLHAKRLGKQSVIRRQPSLCKKYGNEWYLDPGNPGTKKYLMGLAGEITQRYDIDGIHFDYIRYPDRSAGFPDADSFRKYGKGKSLSDWRRNNITDIVRHLYKGIKELKPWVKVSSSPIGKFKDTSRYSSSGWNAYHAVYQDAQGWLREGIMDMLFPMMYFRGNGFFPFALDWQEKCSGRLIVPGLGIYFLHPSERDWPLEEIERQINFTRTQSLAGQAYFRAKFLADNTKRLTDELICNYYAYPALPPAMTWLDSTSPSVPQNLKKESASNQTILSWIPSTDNDTRISPYYVIYASDHFPVNTEKPENILATQIRENQYIYIPDNSREQKTYFAVSAVDRYGNESQAAQLPGCVPAFTLSHTQDSLLLPAENRAEYLILTDVGNRSLLCTSYSPSVYIGSLPAGVYYCLITDEKGVLIRKERFIK